MNQLEQQFKQKKLELEKEAQKFEQINAEKDKVKKVIQAFETELKETIDKAENGLISSGTINEEEYIELRNQSTGLKARIEYNKAKLEDLNIKLHHQAEITKEKVEEARKIRRAIFSHLSKSHFEEWKNENIPALNKLFSQYYFSGEFNSTEEIILFMAKQITDAMIKEP
ncbi:hypothetical protein ACWIUH_12395, partial [Ursidibacter arcticus]